MRNKENGELKVALVQDWLTEIGGAEKVFKGLMDLFPEANIYTLTSHDRVIRELSINKKKLTESFIVKLPWGRKKYRNYLPFFTKAIEGFDFSKYDLVISSSSSVAKGVITSAKQLHICYCHSPVRYAWDLYHRYLDEAGLKGLGIKNWYVRHTLYKLRIWDIISSNRVDQFIANSNYIQRRIKKVYRRHAKVIYPPVDIDMYKLEKEKENYYFVASRMVSYKKIDLIVKTFSKMPEKQLVVAGTGPELKKIKAIASKNTDIKGFVTDEEMFKYMSKAKAFVFAADEDFGIIPVEAQACGTPVIALGVGGTKETVIDGITGIHFYEQTIDSLKNAIDRFESISDFDYEKIRKHAEHFSKNRFLKEIKEYIDEMYLEFNSI